MAGVNKSDIPDIAAFMTVFWTFVKKYWIPEDNETYWEQLTADSSELGRKYDDDFCKGAVLLLTDYLEWKQIRESGRQVDDFCRWLYSRYQKNRDKGK